ncbi:MULTISPECIES: putative toxin-antitoxin system toxin component, PIN family [Moorella]|uniref:tRNA(FMet)-specific endonuclease VapC n=1 Tax=Moorella mulderi DSM 14980 TaxID=1122241 RepID=A0A151B205_9FIRM|nr:putative toxin-antitoxin system toxin component, PIN family [Moorella mulderi]KYH33802.1 tRNA(fMet)-specific endonuclease VapC [Moorella mulderi DSM 14980]
MKIVLDTNVLVSGLLKAHSHAGTIVRLIANGRIRVVYDARILSEYREVLCRPKFGFAKAEVDALITLIEAEGILVTTEPLPVPLPDPDDEPFLEAAMAIEGAILVTGNKKHFTLPESPVTILNPSEFISLWRNIKHK